MTGEGGGKRTRSSYLHSCVLNEEEERAPPSGAPRHYQQIDEPLNHTDEDLDDLSAFLFLVLLTSCVVFMNVE